jgi:transposase
MRTKKVTLRSRRFYTEDFKRTVVNEYERGQFTIIELARLHGIAKKLVYNWIYRYSTYNKKKIIVVEMKESSAKKLKEMEKQIIELERIVGQKQIKIDYLEKMIDIAKQEFDIDIKKNSATPQSNGSGQNVHK